MGWCRRSILAQQGNVCVRWAVVFADLAPKDKVLRSPCLHFMPVVATIGNLLVIVRLPIYRLWSLLQETNVGNAASLHLHVIRSETGRSSITPLMAWKDQQPSCSVQCHAASCSCVTDNCDLEQHPDVQAWSLTRTVLAALVIGLYTAVRHACMVYSHCCTRCLTTWALNFN